jgi:hypothetical protein
MREGSEGSEATSQPKSCLGLTHLLHFLHFLHALPLRMLLDRQHRLVAQRLEQIQLG